jgi:hypothetical protein
LLRISQASNCSDGRRRHFAYFIPWNIHARLTLLFYLVQIL